MDTHAGQSLAALAKLITSHLMVNSFELTLQNFLTKQTFEVSQILPG